ncbi:MAG: RES domain-containing protein [Ruminococcus sp.]|nr:RES domain-containing protein [Ruminococcus sp.]
MTNNNSFDGINKLTSQISNAMKNFNIENHRWLTNTISNNRHSNFIVADIVERQARMLQSLDIPIYNQPSAIEAISIQWDTLAKISEGFKTPEIIQLQNSLLQNDFTALQTFANSLKGIQHIEAPNMALLKMARGFEMVSLPKGLSSAVKQLHIETARKLSTSQSVSFDLSTKMFFVEAEPENKATISETNILCSSLQLLSGLNEADLISFLNCLDQNLPFAGNHYVGQKINDIISNWDSIMNFDCNYYYHARTLTDKTNTYTDEELRKAPKGYTGHGRFNFVGQSHYYYSDVPKGAIIEVSKHSKDPFVQIAKLQPKRAIRMIDLSQEITTQNKFLEFCRFTPSPEQYPNVKREYLLPCYVASCCKQNNIEGIKYYGSKEYKNYVSWDDEYFNIVSSEIRNTKYHPSI